MRILWMRIGKGNWKMGFFKSVYEVVSRTWSGPCVKLIIINTAHGTVWTTAQVLNCSGKYPSEADQNSNAKALKTN